MVAENPLSQISETAASPIFNVERVQLQFSIASDLVAAQVANNLLVLALSSGRILRIDLDNPADIDDIDLPKKTENVEIRRMFLDPTASHLIICTASGENYYLHTQSAQPRPLSRLRGVSIGAIAWNPALPTISTREILIGAVDGNIYEAYIESAIDKFRKEDKYLKLLRKISDVPITGLWMNVVDEVQFPDVRRVLIATESKLFHIAGKIGRLSNESGASIFTRLFEKERILEHEISKFKSSTASQLVISPDPLSFDSSDKSSLGRIFAWLSPQGALHGQLPTSSTSSELGSKIFSEAKLLPRSQLPGSESKDDRGDITLDSIESIALTHWHIIHLIGGRIICTNRLDDQVIFDQVVLNPGQTSLGLFVDQKKNTYWLITTSEIYEIVVFDEDRDIWKIMLKFENFDEAINYTRSPSQKDIVATVYGDYLISNGSYIKAASIYGKSSKPFEQVALSFIENDQQDALRKYLLTKITTYKKSSIMQRMMIASWLIEIFMSKLNLLDDTMVLKVESLENSPARREQANEVKMEFQNFVIKYRTELDKKTTYDIIKSHGREEELIYYAIAVDDYDFVLGYWMQRERWKEALDVLKKQQNPEMFYRYSSGLITHVSIELIDILMRHPDLNPRRLIPALLSYDRNFDGPLHQNQAVRYLLHSINNLNSTDAAIHNTLISIYASHPSEDESALLSYLNSQGEEPFFDSDFALRLCIKHTRVQSCVHIYSNMGQYLQAVNLALAHSAIDLATIIADRPISNPNLRKKLWLAIAKKVISQSNGTKTAIDFLKRCDLLKIEDLISFFPEFVVIDDFKDEICTALEDYSRNINTLKKEMDESSQTASNIRIDIAALDRRYAIVEPGEKCYTCGLPLLSRQFYVFPCQHAFHSDCLGKKITEDASVRKSRMIRELQSLLSKDVLKGVAREKAVAELDEFLGKSWYVVLIPSQSILLNYLLPPLHNLLE
ncbi:Vacuolar protein sorting-associated protein 18-like protein [Golovinomyces cichoracearum]|uniref:Vacuolar protein sorting-associated protein 18-like protein n=1 Tax=Golovinomyces cichoracearum TaxID=62708 RepID=A0A420IB05_9PEZI|nr:Vacuolar protein sorting-associated protein 18-like protein [Golovinomyces cichoracearum]